MSGNGNFALYDFALYDSARRIPSAEGRGGASTNPSPPDIAELCHHSRTPEPMTRGVQCADHWAAFLIFGCPACISWLTLSTLRKTRSVLAPRIFLMSAAL